MIWSLRVIDTRNKKQWVISRNQEKKKKIMSTQPKSSNTEKVEDKEHLDT